MPWDTPLPIQSPVPGNGKRIRKPYFVNLKSIGLHYLTHGQLFAIYANTQLIKIPNVNFMFVFCVVDYESFSFEVLIEYHIFHTQSNTINAQKVIFSSKTE